MRRVFTPVFIGLVLLAAPARAEWQEELSVQLIEEHECELAFLSQVIEREIGANTVVIAKAHCEDGRAFDVLRDNDFKPFDIKECGIVEKIEC